MRCKKLLITTVWLSASVACCNAKSSHPAPTPVSAPTPLPVTAPLLLGAGGNCSLSTASQWQDFLTRNAADNRWVDTCEDSTCNAEFFDYVQTNVQQVLSNCSSVIEQNPKIAACSQNLRRFTPSWMRQHDADSYGFNIPNHAYLAAETTADRPSGMMDVPPEIVAALPTKAKVEEAARINGWKYLTHDSALGTQRTFIYIPDPAGRFDRWMLLNLDGDPNAFDTGVPLSIIGVQKMDGAGHVLPRVQLNFRDYNITVANGAASLSLPEDRSGKCFSCHPSGVRRLIERRTKVTAAKPVKGEPAFDPSGTALPPTDFAYQRLLELNKILDGYGLPDWQGMVSPEDLGPPLGKELGCVRCHNGSTRGILTVATSVDQLEQKMAVQLSMPPQAGLIQLLEKSEQQPAFLTADERQTLQTAKSQHDDWTGSFEDARAPALSDWILQQSCQ